MGPPVSVLVYLTDISSVRVKEDWGATAASLKGLKCRGASLRRNHEAERDREAIQSRNADRKRIGLWQLRLKYRGETSNMNRPSNLIPKSLSVKLRIPQHVAIIRRPVSRRIG